MKFKNKILHALILLALLLIPAAPAFALGPYDDGEIIFGGNYTLESGKTVDGDLVVFGGNVEIQEDALVKGSIVVFGGNVTLDGTMEGDLVIFGGSGSLGPKSVVEGDLVTVGGSVSRAEGSVVKGDIQNEPAIQIPAPTVPDLPDPNVPLPNTPVNVEPINPVNNAVQALVMAVVMGGLAMLLILFLNPQMERVSQTAFTQPLIAGGVGVLSFISIVVMALTILLIPVAFLVAFLFIPLAWVLGIVSIGMEVGERFTRAIDQAWAPALSAGFGTFLIMLIVGGLGVIPCVGWVFETALALVAIGAAGLTVFGSRSYPPAMAAPAAGSVEEALPPAS